MKKFIIGLFMLIVFPCFANVRDVQDNYQLIYHIVDISGDHIGSETVALKIKRVSDGYWYDFNDDTFKNSGWTSKSSNLSEDATEGYYYYTFNPPASETGAEQYLLLIDNASVTYGDHQSTIVCYQDIGDAVDTDIDAQLAAIQTDLDSPNQYKATDPWSIELPGSYTGIQAGKTVGDNIDAEISSRATPSDVTIYVGQ